MLRRNAREAIGSIDRRRPESDSAAGPRLYDCFTFFNELDLLEIRLNVLSSVVDRFVLVEATRTHQGEPKPLFYSDNAERYRPFHDRIVHVVVDDYPPNPDEDPWVLERHQRHAIHRGLGIASPEDVVHVSDLDEVPNPGALSAVLPPRGVRILCLQLHYYFFDRVLDGNPFDWVGPRGVVSRLRDMPDVQAMRDLSFTMFSPPLPGLRGPYHRVRKRYLGVRHRVSFVPAGGWHFSYLGGIDTIATKLRSFAHREHNVPAITNPATLEARVREGVDLFGRPMRFSSGPPWLPLPGYVVSNRSRYAHLFAEPLDASLIPANSR